MPGGKLIVLGEEDGKALRELLTALKDAIPHMRGMRVGFYSLKDANNVTRLLKLLAADKEQTNPAGQGAGGEYEEVELEFCHPTLGNCTGTFLVKDIEET